MSGLTDFEHGITAIDTALVRPRFDASHLIVQDGRAAFVDTGTLHSVPHLLEGLAARGLEPAQVDYVLLTHVHLDHAGGAGGLMQALPNATAVLHPRGARHMIDPAKLRAGSVAVYGEEQFQAMYGDIVPIAADRVITVDDGERLSLGGRSLEFLHTEGHARHHYCIVDEAADAVFSGDTFGISYREFDTAHGEFIFPTTTPVHFDPPAAHASVDRLMSYRPRSVFLTHYSRVGDLERLAGDMHACLDAFVALAERCDGRDDRAARLREGLYALLSERLDAHGYTGDERTRRSLLDADVELNSQGLEVWLDHGRHR